MLKEQQSSYDYDELIGCGHGELFGDGNARLPLPPMLMFDRITKISDKGGTYDKGVMQAELDVKQDLWFFDCHFETDPVMPGCLGVDALWQLIGFYLGWIGQPGRGRALGSGDIKFTGQITRESKLVTYNVDFKRVIKRKLTMGIADGEVLVDGRKIYTGKDMRVGLFTSTEGF